MDLDVLQEQFFSAGATSAGLVVYIVYAVTMWRVFSKAGYPGILALIPLVNWIVLVKIAGFSGWAALLYLIPIVGWIFAIVVAFREGANFGKGGAFSFFLLWLFPFIGHLIIGFDGSRYRRA